MKIQLLLRDIMIILIHSHYDDVISAMHGAAERAHVMFAAIMLSPQQPILPPGLEPQPLPPQQFSPTQPSVPVAHDAMQHTALPVCILNIP